MQRRLFLRLGAGAAAGFSLSPPVPTAAEAARGKLYVCNTAGDDVSVVDPVRQEVLRSIKTGSHPHGLAALPDGRRLFCSVESERCLKVIDPATDEIQGSIALSGVPNQLAVTPDGRWLYVAIASSGSADVVDVGARQVVKTLPVGRHAHNCYCPKGARFMYATSIADHLVRQFDFGGGHTLKQTIRFDGAVRPLCVTRDERRLFVALEGLHGFAWADLTTGQQVGRAEHPLPPPDRRSKFAYLLTHGLDLRPGDRELWVTSFIGNALMVWDVTGTEPKYLTSVPTGDAPNWITFSADGKYVYAANAGDNSVSIIDCDARKLLRNVKVGLAPKRLLEVAPPLR